MIGKDKKVDPVLRSIATEQMFEIANKGARNENMLTVFFSRESIGNALGWFKERKELVFDEILQI